MKKKNIPADDGVEWLSAALMMMLDQSSAENRKENGRYVPTIDSATCRRYGLYKSDVIARRNARLWDNAKEKALRKLTDLDRAVLGL